MSTEEHAGASGADPMAETSGHVDGPAERSETPGAGEMTNEQRDKLQLTRDDIERQLQVDDVLPHLKNVFTERDEKKIKEPKEDKQRASVLLDILLERREEVAYHAFHDSLMMVPKYANLVITLDRAEIKGMGTLQKDDKIQVVIRVRPLQKGEEREESFKVESPTQVSIAKQHVEQFAFDSVFPEDTTQAKIFDTMGRPVVDAVLDGYNGCIICYGKTASGKTYTMVGPSNFNEETYRGPDAGIIYRALEELFEKSQKKQDWTFTFSVSVFEIYEEKVYDLTKEKPQGLGKEESFLRVREETSKGIFFAEGLQNHFIKDAKTAFKLFSEASDARRSTATNANERSSRSHMVFKVNVVARVLHKEGAEAEQGRTGQLYLVDLAGSESADDAKDGKSLQEGSSIRNSLFYLKNVISALSKKTCEDHNFVNSVLTKLLKGVLKGNSKTAFIVNVDPSKKSLGYTRRSLHFAKDAKNIQIKPPEINFIPFESLCVNYMKTMAEMKTQIKTLTREIAQTKKNSGGRRSSSEVPQGSLVDLADEVGRLVTSSVTNTTEEFFEKLSDKLQKDNQVLQDEISVLTQKLHQAQQENSEEIKRLRNELQNKLEQTSEELRQIKQALGELASNKTAIIQQIETAVEKLTNVNLEMWDNVNIRPEIRNRDEMNAGAGAGDDVQASQPGRQASQPRIPPGQNGTADHPCYCCEVCCKGMWYLGYQDKYEWYDLRGKGFGWVLLLVMLYIPIIPIIVVLLINSRSRSDREGDRGNNYSCSCAGRCQAQVAPGDGGGPEN